MNALQVKARIPALHVLFCVDITRFISASNSTISYVSGPSVLNLAFSSLMSLTPLLQGKLLVTYPYAIICQRNILLKHLRKI